MITLQPLSNIVDRVVEIMTAENCRLFDHDIIKALNRTTYDINKFGVYNVRVDTSELSKFR